MCSEGVGQAELSGHTGGAQPQTAPLQAHNAASLCERIWALLSPAHEASPGQVARSCRSLARPRRAPRAARLRSSAHPSPCPSPSSRLRCAGPAASSPPLRRGRAGPPCDRFQPSRSVSPAGSDASTHTDMDIDPRVCRRGGSSLGGRLFTTDCEKVFFYITVASNAQQLRPWANPARSRSRHFPPGMMRGAGRPSTCLLFQPYTAQRNPERPLLPSHADER